MPMFEQSSKVRTHRATRVLCAFRKNTKEFALETCDILETGFYFNAFFSTDVKKRGKGG